MADAKTTCPKCGGHVAFPKEFAGNEAPCPHCNETILLPKAKPTTAWMIASGCIITALCLAGVLLWEHRPKHDAMPQIHVAENANPQPAVVQQDPQATGQLMAAIQYGGQAKAVKVLLEKGADVNAKDNSGWRPLQLAAKRGDVEIVRCLLEKGADIDATNISGATALISAASRGYIDVVKLLLKSGADVNAKQVFGSTALSAAVEGNHLEMVKFLLASGAKVNTENSSGYSALDATKETGNAAMVQLLEQAGATKSSAVARQEEMATNLRKLKESGIALSNSMIALSNSGQDVLRAFSNAVIESSKPMFEVVNVSAKPTEQNDMWWRYGYRLTVRNNSQNNEGQWFDIQFLDNQGYVIYSVSTHKTIIKPGATEVITGDTLLNLPGASRVAKLKAIWNP